MFNNDFHDFDRIIHQIKDRIHEKYGDNIIHETSYGIKYIDPESGLKVDVCYMDGSIRKVVGPFGPKNLRFRIYQLDDVMEL